MFRFRIRTLLVCITVIAVLLAAAVAAWNEGMRHEQLQKSLLQRKAYVVMSHQESFFSPTGTIKTPRIERRSTLPWLLETTGLSKIFRRIESISIRTSEVKNEEIDSYLDNVREVGSLSNLAIGYENTPDQRLVDLVNDVSIKKLVITTEMLRATKGQWIAKDLKILELIGADFGHNDLALLPKSVEELIFLSNPDSTVDAKSFESFARLKVIHFIGDVKSSELVESINKNSNIHAD